MCSTKCAVQNAPACAAHVILGGGGGEGGRERGRRGGNEGSYLCQLTAVPLGPEGPSDPGWPLDVITEKKLYSTERLQNL